MTHQGLGRSRGGPTRTIHPAGEGARRPLALLITPGQWADASQLVPLMESGSASAGTKSSGRSMPAEAVEQWPRGLTRAYVFHGTVTAATTPDCGSGRDPGVRTSEPSLRRLGAVPATGVVQTAPFGRWSGRAVD